MSLKAGILDGSDLPDCLVTGIQRRCADELDAPTHPAVCFSR